MAPVPFRAALFKGTQVFARCNGEGALLVEDGAVTFTYKLGASKGYRTVPGRLELSTTAPTQLAEDPAVDPPAPRGADGGAGGRAKSKAASPATPRVPSARDDDPQAIHIWADGACSGNPGPCGAGTVLVIDGHPKEWSTWLGIATNNVGELWAVLQGLRGVPRPVERTVIVHTDSKYSIGVLSQGWKAKVNQQLIAEIKEELGAFPKVRWHWVPGHAGIALNERCDALARGAIERRTSTVNEPSPGPRTAVARKSDTSAVESTEASREGS